MRCERCRIECEAHADEAACVLALRETLDGMANESVPEALVRLRQECARVAHKKSADINVGDAVGLIDLLPFMIMALPTGREEA